MPFSGYCFRVKAAVPDSNVNSDSAAVVTKPQTTEALKDSQLDWKNQYEEILQKMIDDGYQITAAWVEDVDGDGVPMVALSTNSAVYRIPNIILNYEDGKAVVKDDIVNSGSGWSVVDEVWFCEKTDYVIFRYYGNTTGTLTTNRQTIYNISEFGTYSVCLDNEIFLPGEYEEEISAFHNAGNSSFDLEKYQNYFVEEMDKDARELIGDDAVFVNYAYVMREFYDYSDNVEYETVVPSVVAYLNGHLGTDLTANTAQSDAVKAEDIATEYKKILAKCTEGNRYGVYDIDGNGVKELIVETGIYKRDLQWNIYTYENAAVFTGSFDATYYGLYTEETANGLFMYKVVKETEELKKISLLNNKAEESVVVEMRPYNESTALNPGKELQMADYNDYALLENI